MGNPIACKGNNVIQCGLFTKYFVFKGWVEWSVRAGVLNQKNSFSHPLC